MASIFHQNMRVFGGGSAPRNAAFNIAFGAINGVLGNVLIAAGFTEISNPNAPLRGQLLTLSGQLDAGLTSLTVAEVGTSALGLTEYLGMSWDPAVFNVQHGGQCVYNNLARAWQANIVPAALPNVIPAPGGAFLAADQRGPAFLAGIFGGAPLIVMFMHNMYGLGDRTRGFDGMPSCGSAIRLGIGGAYAGALVIAGGDYNIAPRFAGRKRGRDGTLIGMNYRAAKLGGVPINTTATNPYDFWLASDVTNIPEAWARVLPQSRVAPASDHAGIALRIS